MACFFFNREYVSYSAQYICKIYWQEYYTLCQEVIVKPYSNDITLENLKFSVQISRNCTYLCRKSNEGTLFN